MYVVNISITEQIYLLFDIFDIYYHILLGSWRATLPSRARRAASAANPTSAPYRVNAKPRIWCRVKTADDTQDYIHLTSTTFKQR